MYAWSFHSPTSTNLRTNSVHDDHDNENFPHFCITHASVGHVIPVSCNTSVRTLCTCFFFNLCSVPCSRLLWLRVGAIHSCLNIIHNQSRRQVWISYVYSTQLWRSVLLVPFVSDCSTSTWIWYSCYRRNDRATFGRRGNATVGLFGRALCFVSSFPPVFLLNSEVFKSLTADALCPTKIEEDDTLIERKRDDDATYQVTTNRLPLVTSHRLTHHQLSCRRTFVS